MQQEHEDIKRWREQALAIETVSLPVPLDVLLGEAADVVRQFDARWTARIDPKKKTILMPGLELAVPRKAAGRSAKAGIPFRKELRDEIVSLIDGTQAAQTNYLLVVDQNNNDVAAQARFLLGEIKAVLEWAFDDGVQDDKDVKLANVSAAHEEDGDTVDELAAAVSDYATLAKAYRDEIDGLLGFDAAQLDDVHALVSKLRALPTKPEHNSARKESQDALTLRNGMATLLQMRVQRVRNAARGTFRNHPEVIREFTSGYERRRRAESRRKGKEEEKKTEVEK
jgi:hypothetical protein